MTRWTPRTWRRFAGLAQIAGPASVLLGGAMLVAAALDCTDGGTLAVRLAVIGVVAAGVGLGLRRAAELPVVLASSWSLSCGPWWSTSSPTRSSTR